MKLYHHVDRGIKLPIKSVDKIFYSIVYTVLSGMNVKNGDTVDALCRIFDISYNDLLTEYRKDIRSRGHKQFVFVHGIEFESIPYYHTSNVVKNKLKALESEELLIKCLIDLTGEYEGEGRFDPNSDVMTINAHSLAVACDQSHLRNAPRHVAKEALKVYKVLQHEMMHVVQIYALPEKQYDVSPEYHCVDTTRGNRRDGYYTSTAELKPYLANMQEQFINTCVRDSYWDTFDDQQKREVFKMFVGMKSSPMALTIEDCNIKITIPCTDYFTALKRSNYRLHRDAVKDFYKTVSVFF